MISDLSEPNLSINRDSPVWTTELYSRYTSVIDALAGYDNVIGFFIGDEVTNAPNNSLASAYVKAAVRDMKAYVKAKSTRWLGIGYAANDDSSIRADLFQYLNCGDQGSAVDYVGLNNYEWCGDSTFINSGYNSLTKFFANYSVPVFFAEYGCNTVGGADGRLWAETTELYSTDMTYVWSGGIAYEYFEETNDFGIASVSNSQVSTMKNFGVLSSRLAAATPSSTSLSAYTPTNSALPCPATSSDWQASNKLPPIPNAAACACMYSSLSCVPANSLSASAYGPRLSTICSSSTSYCEDIAGNPTTGTYGNFSMCNSTQQLGYALDAYYKGQGSSSSACNFKGQAVITKAATDVSTCLKMLASTASTGSSTTSATGSSTSSVPGPSQPASTASSGLSGGAIAGVVIGPLGAILLGILLLFFYRRNRKKSGSHAARQFDPDLPQLQGNPVSELPLTLATGIPHHTTETDPESELKPPDISELDTVVPIRDASELPHEPRAGYPTELESRPPMEEHSLAEAPRSYPYTYPPGEIPELSNSPAPAVIVPIPSPDPPITDGASAPQAQSHEDEQMNELLQRQAELRERRTALLQLQQIQEEEAEVRRRIESLRQRNPSGS